MRVNPELVKLARARLTAVAGRLLEKQSFVPMDASGAGGAPPMDPAMAAGGGGAPPADPSMAGGGGGMDPSMAGGGGGAPQPPTGQDPAAGMPPLQVNLNDLVQLMSMVGGGQTGAPAGPEAGGPAGAGPEGAAPAEAAGKKKKPAEAPAGDPAATMLLQQVSGKLDNLTALLNQVLGALGQVGGGGAGPEAGPEAGGAGPGPDEVASMGQGEQVSPETMGAEGPMGGQLTGPMPGGMPPGAPPGGMPPGMPPGMSPGGAGPGMIASASLNPRHAKSAQVNALNRIISRLTDRS